MCLHVHVNDFAITDTLVIISFSKSKIKLIKWVTDVCLYFFVLRCKAICREFFHNGGLEKALAKDKRRQKFEESVHKPSENWIPDISEKVMQESVSVTENIFSESQEV